MRSASVAMKVREMISHISYQHPSGSPDERHVWIIYLTIDLQMMLNPATNQRWSFEVLA